MRIQKQKRLERKKRLKKELTMIICLIYIFQIFFGMTVVTRAADTDIPLSIEKIVDKTSVYSGEEFTYTIKYANPNSTEHANKIVITDVLPESVKFVSASGSADVMSVEEPSSLTGGTVKFVFKEILSAGSSGIVKITVKFPEGITPDGTVALNSAKIKGDNTKEITSNDVTVTSKVKAPDFDIAKTRIVPTESVLPAVGQPVTYEITLKGNSAVGGLDLTNVRIKDTLPAGAEFVSASDGGVFSSGNIEWNIGTLPAGSLVKRQATVRYPSSLFDVNDNGKTTSVTNTAVAYATPEGGTELTDTAVSTHGFAVPTAALSTFTKSSRQPNDEYSIGQTAVFNIGNIKNTGNIPVDKLIIEDEIPDGIKLTGITIGSFNMTANIAVSYKTNKNDWTEWTGGNYKVSSLGLINDEYITNVRWNFGNGIPAGFQNTSNIQVLGEVMSIYRDNTTPVKINDKITNRANLTWEFDDNNNGKLRIQRNISRTLMHLLL